MAQTGTGKTLSFLISIVEMIEKVQRRDTHALIVLPTRELVMQVERYFRAIRSSQAKTVVLVVGGMSEQTQLGTIRCGSLQHFVQLHRPLRHGPRMDLHALAYGSILAARKADISFAKNTGHSIC